MARFLFILNVVCAGLNLSLFFNSGSLFALSASLLNFVAAHLMFEEL